VAELTANSASLNLLDRFDVPFCGGGMTGEKGRKERGGRDRKNPSEINFWL